MVVARYDPYRAEQTLRAVPGLNLLSLRPGYFYYNFFGNLSMIKMPESLAVILKMGNEDKLIMSSTDDIASAAASALQQLDFSGFTVQYLVSDELNSQEIAQKIGNAIGKPNFPRITLYDDRTGSRTQSPLGAGLPADKRPAPDALARNSHPKWKNV